MCVIAFTRNVIYISYCLKCHRNLYQNKILYIGIWFIVLLLIYYYCNMNCTCSRIITGDFSNLFLDQHTWLRNCYDNMNIGVLSFWRPVIGVYIRRPDWPNAHLLTYCPIKLLLGIPYH